MTDFNYVEGLTRDTVETMIDGDDAFTVRICVDKQTGKAFVAATLETDRQIDRNVIVQGLLSVAEGIVTHQMDHPAFIGEVEIP